jgi:hypothetical protein
MTREELKKFANGTEHFRASGFYWYNGEYLEGRIVEVHEEDSPFDDSPFSYYFMKHDDYIPGQGKNDTYEDIKKVGRLIHHPDCIELTDGYNRHGNTEQADLPYNKQFKKLIIVGAGASYDFDSQEPNEREFPLTNNLFKPQTGKLIHDYKGALARQNDLANCRNVEEYFQRKWIELNDSYNPGLLAELVNIQYYLHEFFLIRSMKHEKYGLNNYTSLCNHLQSYCHRHRDENVAIISYNYDTLLDSAVENKYKFTYTNLNDYVDASSRPFVLFKPHGSANWIKKFASMREGHSGVEKTLRKNGNEMTPIIENNKAVLNMHKTIPKFSGGALSSLANDVYRNGYNMSTIQNYSNLDIDVADKKEFQYNNRSHGSEYITIGFNYFPQLLIPYKDKDDFVMPRSHSLALKKILPQVDEILIIGWKGEERKMQDMLSQNCKTGIKVSLVTDDSYDIKDQKSGVNNHLNVKPLASSKGEHSVRATLEPFLKNSNWTINPKGFTGFIKDLINDEVEFFKK